MPTKILCNPQYVECQICLAWDEEQFANTFAVFQFSMRDSSLCKPEFAIDMQFEGSGAHPVKQIGKVSEEIGNGSHKIGRTGMG